ncbi:MAG TPA: M56 family metallopeptidase, partial [Flavobacteriaceae bacterium]|nr:M56 family metallopeptidase [Flavobacteriaceae bacterium]
VTGTSWGFNWWWLYGLGACVACFIFIYKVFKIYRVLWHNNTQEINGYKVVVLHNSNMAFSCFGYVVLGSELSAEEQQTILQHEAIHIDQKHSWDLLLFELLRIVFWFNPLVYMYQSRISILHEYIADAAAIKNQGKQAYYKGLLNQVFNTQNISFINTFFNQSLIKKRIVMLQKSRSKQTRLIKYALLIPLVFGMLIYTSCDTSETEVVEQEASVLEQIEGLKTTMEKNGGLTDEERAELLKLWLKTKDGNSELVLGENYYAEIKDESVEESIEVPYSVVEKAPVFPGCETSLDNGAQKACFNAKMMEHVVANFNRNLAKEAGLTGVQKISVFFKIDANGNIIDAKARAPHPKLEEEALRVVGLLPKMTPATQRGKQVTVPYYLPIKFEAQ